jgi:hypothetical protein
MTFKIITPQRLLTGRAVERNNEQSVVVREYLARSDHWTDCNSLALPNEAYLAASLSRIESRRWLIATGAGVFTLYICGS